MRSHSTRTSATPIAVASVSLMAIAACAPQVSTDDRPCPCEPGWTCCPETNVCMAPGLACVPLIAMQSLDASGIVSPSDATSSAASWRASADGPSIHEATTNAGPDVDGLVPLNDVVQIAIGSNRTAAVMSDGTVRGAGQQAYLPWGANGGATFEQIAFLSDVTQIALNQASISSETFGCAVLSGGAVECWGDNDSGQLGSGTTVGGSDAPVMTALNDVIQIAAGYKHACALESNGSVWCWGLGANGQVGNGSTSDAWAPAQVTALPGAASSIAVGFNDSCAVVNRGLWCWGSNDTAQLGQGISNEIPEPTPLQVPGVADVVQVALGSYHGCALQSSGYVFCWGGGGAFARGQLCGGSVTTSLSPPATPQLNSVRQIVASTVDTCSLRTDGNVVCCGENNNGELGDGMGMSTGTSTPVRPLRLPLSASLVGSAGTWCAVGFDAGVECWGPNRFGQLGNGTTNTAWVPAPIQF